MKVLKIAAIVIGAAALIATGVGVAAGLSIGAAFAGVAGSVAGALGVSGTLVGSVLLGAIGIAVTSALEAVIPKPSASSGTQTKWKPDPYAGNPYVMGRTLVGGNIVLRRGHGKNNTYETFVTILTICTAASIDTTFLNKTTTTFDGGGAATGTYAGQIWQRTQLGLCPEPAALNSPVGNPPGWTSAHKLSGLAASILTLKYDTRQTNGLTTEPAPSWIGHWVKVYDPRLDSTYPGGSGPCRAYDEDTYVWSENPHLHGLTWSMGRYQNGVRVAGIGTGTSVPGGAVKGIDVASFVEGANLDDARSWKIGGQVTSRPDTLWNSLKSMLQAGGAQPALIGGVITSINRAPRVSLATITRDDIVGKCTFAGTQPRRSRLNGIIPQYRSEAHDWEMVSASEVSVPAFVALDGDERTKEISYPLVQDVDQVSQLAVYDLYDLREAGPGSIPLKPWWLNYKVGDCVTFQPEDNFSIKTLITGRALEAQSGTVTYTVRGETDGKHAYALGQTGVAPPIVSLHYGTGVAAPDGDDWSLSGATLTGDGVSIPALVLTGAIGNSSADAVIFDYRVHNAANGADDNWNTASFEPAATTRKEFGTVTSGTQYDVGVRYRVRGVIGERLILGPATAGQFGIDRGAHTILPGTQTVTYPVTSTATEIDVAPFSAVIDTTATIAFPAGAITGLTGAKTYVVLWRLSTASYVVVPYPANTEMASSDYVFLLNQSTLNADGTAPEGDSPPPGYAGGGSGCPIESALVLLANDAHDGPGETIAIGDLRTGMYVWSPHEWTGEWAAWRVSNKWRFPSRLYAIPGRPETSGSHLWSRDALDPRGGFDRAVSIAADTGRTGTVIGVAIEGAHTYTLVLEDGSQWVSHNKFAEPIAD